MLGLVAVVQPMPSLASAFLMLFLHQERTGNLSFLLWSFQVFDLTCQMHLPSAVLSMHFLFPI